MNRSNSKEEVHILIFIYLFIHAYMYIIGKSEAVIYSC